MESQYLSLAFITLTTLFITIYYVKSIQKSRRNKPKLPPKVSGGLPLLGHLNLLSGPELPHVTLSSLAEKYGPIFTLQLGMQKAMVVSNWETAKECFSNQNDVIFSNRPKTEAIQHMSYDFAMFGFKDHGPYWRELRKITMITLLSNQSVERLANLREVEVGTMMESLYQLRGHNKKVEMKKVFEDLTLNFMTRIAFGDVEDEDKEMLHEPIKEFFRVMGVLTLSDVLPFMKWLSYFGGMKKVFGNVGKKMDIVLQSWIEKHKKHGKDYQSFMRKMMDVADRVSQEFPEYDADTITKATCQAMILGGTESMTVTLVWALCLLLNNRHTLIRAQQELDNHVGRERLVKESDTKNLDYIRAVLKETLRICPAAPLLFPRMSADDCTVAGYDIPAGCQLMINAYKLQRDPNVWSDPLQFKPERFLEEFKDVDFSGQDFELIPFGAGRRICPGISFAMQIMELALASLLHGFEIDTMMMSDGDEPAAVDMTGSLGATNAKATPLEVFLKPRLSPDAYSR